MDKIKENCKVYINSLHEYGVVKSRVIDLSGSKIELYRVRTDSGRYITSINKNLKVIK